MKNFILTALFVTLLSASAFAATANVIATIDGLVCDFCARSLEKTFGKQVEVDSIKVDLTAKTVAIFFKDGQSMPDDQITKLITDSGYTVKNIVHDAGGVK